MSQLTSDMVWLVEQTVTLTDGSQVQALVPVVYLSQLHTADLRPTGALISGQSVHIAAKGDITNNGALQAQTSILLAANKVTNELGRIDASQGSTRIMSDTDILNRSGFISGNTVQLDAAQDIRIDTLTRQFTSSQQTAAGQVSGSNTALGPQGAIVSRGDLTLAAGRDVQLAGALVSAQGNAGLSAGANLVVDTVQTRQGTLDTGSSGVRQTQGITHLGSTVQAGGKLSLSSSGDTTLKAAQVYAGQDLSVLSGGDLSITAAKNTTQLDENLRAKNYVRIDHSADESVIGSTLTAGGNVTLAALQALPGSGKGNITIEGSSVNAQTGTLSVVADGSVSVVEAREQHEYDLYNKTTKKGFLSSKSTSEHNTGASDLAVGSSLSGKDVSIVSGKNITVRGSSVISDEQTRLLAANNVTLEAASNSNQDSQLKQQTRSGLFSSGGLSVTWGKQQQSADTQNTRTTATASTVGSIGGDVAINAGEAYKQVGSDVLAPSGDISISARKVDIIEARETSKTVAEQKFSQSGLTLAITSPVISAIETMQQMSQAAGDTSDGRMQLLAAANAGLAANNAAKAIQAGQGSPMNGKEGQIATGGKNEDGSAASRDANAADKVGGINLAISIGGSKSQNTATSQSDNARGSSVTAGGDIAITATGAGQDSNLTIQGSVVEAGKSALLFADNQIKLLAAQNTASQNSSNSASSGSIGISFGTNGGISFNVSASKAKGQGNGSDETYTNTLVKAGNDANSSIRLVSGGDTTLRGAVVAANQVKADIGGDLKIESLQDKSSYTSAQSSSGVSLSVSITGVPTGGGISASKSNISSDFNSVTQQSGIKVGDGGFQVDVQGNTDLKGAVIASTDKAVNFGNNSFTTGGTLTTSDIQNSASYQGKATGLSINVGEQAGKYDVNGVGVGMGSDQGNASSSTSSGISGIAANTAVRSTDPETGIAKIFDAEKVQREINAQMQITQAFSKEAPKAVASFAAGQAAELRKQGKEEEAKKWDENGSYRIALHTAAGALGGGLSGAAGAAASASTANLMNALQDNIQQSLQTAGLSEGAAKVLAQGVATLTAAGVGAAIGGAQGAATAATVDANNRALHPTDKQLASKLAAKGKYTKEQIEEQMRLMGNSLLGVGPNTVEILIGPDAVGNNITQDPGMPKAVSGTGVVEVLGQANFEIQQYIVANTKEGSGYIPGVSQYVMSNISLNGPTITNTPPTMPTANCANNDLACKSGVGVQQSPPLPPLTPQQQQAVGEYFGKMSTDYQRAAAFATATGNAPVVLAFEIAAGVTGLLELAFLPSMGKVVVDSILIDTAADAFVRTSGIPRALVFEVVEREIKPRFRNEREKIDGAIGLKK